MHIGILNHTDIGDGVQIAEGKRQGMFDLNFIRQQAAEIRSFLAVTEREVATDYDPVIVYTR